MNPWHPLPAAVYTLVEQTPGAVLLESSRPGSASLSRLFTDPLRILEAREFADLPHLFAQIEVAIANGLLVAGYFAYECGQYFEPTAALRPRRENDLLAWLGVYRHCCRFDHAAGAFLDRFPIASAEKPDKDERIAKADDLGNAPIDGGSLTTVIPDFALNEAQFAERIAQIHHWIRSGDVYQLNFTFPIRAQFIETPGALYARLRAAQPVDYAAFLHCRPARHILSLSPELFFRIDQDAGIRRITTQPMKGTARRGRTTAEDAEISSWLRRDPKNRAENVMIVDLIRNDLGRLCTYGSVRVDQLFEVERYPTLWQMTSTVTGELRPDVGCEQIFRALFPCGSITGAPKVRAMQLLAQIEEEPRGVYTGAIGYFSREQSVFSVAIRTLQLENSNATMGIGGGIVIDSDHAAEFRECQLKAEFLTRPYGPFSLIETLLWRGEYPFIELHLDRLADSARYFGFQFDRPAIRAALIRSATSFRDRHSRKVRLLLNPDGSSQIYSEPLPEPLDDTPGRVCISSHRIDPADPFLFHKTTRRPIYDRAFADASAAGYSDILFLNLYGEVTEGAISNVFIEKDGRFYTPPLDSGVLPGAYRRHLLETRPDIEEKKIYMNDLKAADGVYLSNAVRGLRRVTIDFQFNQEIGNP